MTDRTWLWIVFSAAVAVMLALDLGVFHRKAHAVSKREALRWSVVWVTLALLFAAGVWVVLGPAKGLEFLTGYAIEKSLSVDNLFVFVIVFSYFRVDPRWQHRVLFWGIIGALLLRGVLIAAGTAVVERFQWTLYLFGAILVWTAVKMALHSDENTLEPEHNPVVRWVRRHVPMTNAYDGDRFFTVQDGRRLATPLFLVVVVVETTDVVFATDSLPAIFGITSDPFIVYTSNVFAILGLRALYFLLAGVLGMFRFLKLGISVVLGFIGVKMLIRDWVHVSTGISLAVVAAVLAVSVAASMLLPSPQPPPDGTGGDDEAA